MDCFWYNRTLTSQRSARLPHTVCPPLVFPFGKGFIAFDQPITKAFYYEIP